MEHSPHDVAGLRLHVSLHEPESVREDDVMDIDHEGNSMVEDSSESSRITIIASGISPSTTEDAVRNYFENSRRSGGGEVCDIDFNSDEGNAVITFTEVEGNVFKIYGFC